MSKMMALGLLAALALAPAGCAQPAGKPAPARAETSPAVPGTASGAAAEVSGLATDEQKELYTLGLVLARNLGPFSLEEKDLPVVIQGMTDGTLKKEPKLKLEEWGPKLKELQKARAAKAAEAQKKLSAEFLGKAAAEKGAVKKPSGLIYTSLKEGTGPSPKATDRVKVHYHGTLVDGKVFDSSVQRGQPISFPLNGVIPCWTEGFQMMKTGGRSKLVCPSQIAYGDQGQGPIPPGATLVFEVELIGIEPPAAVPAAAVPAAPPLPRK